VAGGCGRRAVWPRRTGSETGRRRGRGLSGGSCAPGRRGRRSPSSGDEEGSQRRRRKTGAAAYRGGARAARRGTAWLNGWLRRPRRGDGDVGRGEGDLNFFERYKSSRGGDQVRSADAI
jgi:hypothetical protein